MTLKLLRAVIVVLLIGAFGCVIGAIWCSNPQTSQNLFFTSLLLVPAGLILYVISYEG